MRLPSNHSAHLRPFGSQYACLTIHHGSLITHRASLNPRHFVKVSADLLKLGYSVRFRAPGRSMEPTILDGDVVIVGPVAPSQVKRGDIILYRTETGVIAHRVVRIIVEKARGAVQDSERSTEHSFVLRGDASGTLGEMVKPAQIMGRVVSVERNGRHIRLDTRKARFAFQKAHCVRQLKRVLYCAVRKVGHFPLPLSKGPC